jgi:hypothetical protein
MSIRQIAWCAVTAVLVAACGGNDATPGGKSDTGAGGGGGGEGGAGAVGGGGGGHTEPTAGITGCAEVFVDADGVCRPTLEKCPAGQIPKFDEGCVPVGIPGCAALFMEDDGLCHPAAAKCGAGTYPVPSEGCVSVDGNGCGSDTWGLITAQAGDQNVDATYAGGDSDGSRSKPWTTIAAALAAAGAGARIVIAAGTYDEPIAPTAGVEIVGRCASMVTVSGTQISDLQRPTIVVLKSVPGKVTLRGIRLSGDGVGVEVTKTDVDMEDVWVDHASIAGISIKGSGKVASLHHVLVSGTLQSGGSLGSGIDVLQGGNAKVHQSAMIGTSTWAIASTGAGTQLELTDAVIDGTLPEKSDGQYGLGVDVLYGGSATVERVAAIGNPAAGVSAYDVKSVTVKDSLIEKSLGGAFSEGIEASRENLSNATDMTAEGLAILNIDGPGVAAFTARVAVSRTLVAHGKPTPTNPHGSYGVQVSQGAAVSLQDSAAYDIQGAGILEEFADGNLTASGVLLQQTTEFAPNVKGGGLGEAAVIHDGAAAFTRVAMVANAHEGVTAEQAATVTLTECLVSGTKPSSKQEGGVGVYADGSTLTVESSRVEGSTSAGIALLDTVGKLSGDVIDGVESGAFLVLADAAPAVPGVGDGILVARGSTQATSISGCWVSGAARAGISYSSSPGEVTGSTTSKCQYGLVIQGDPAPTIGDDNEFSGTDQDTLKDGMLPSP